MCKAFFRALLLGLLLLAIRSAHAAQLYWNDGNLIHRAALDGGGPQNLDPTYNALGIAANPADGLFWTDDVPRVPIGPTGTIRHADLNGMAMTDVLPGIPTPIGIALDAAHGKMYWTDSANVIHRANLDGTNVENLINQPSIAELSGIVVDAAHSRFYFSFVNPLIDSARPGGIGSANLDGSDFQIAVGQLVNPQGLGLDPSGILYWTDVNRLQRAPVGGTAQDLVTGLDLPFGLTLDVPDQMLFWTDPAGGVIQRAPFTGGAAIDVLTNLSNPTAIAIYAPVPEPGSLALVVMGLVAFTCLAGWRRGTIAVVEQKLGMVISAQDRRVLAYWLVALAALGAVKALAASDEPTSDPQDVKRVEEYLSANVQGKWRNGPTRVANKSVVAAYHGFRFYYVFSPKYPVARSYEVSLMLRLDKAGKVAPLKTPADYNVGLMTIVSDDDAQTAAAAVMSLTFGPFGPVSVAPHDVKVKHDGKGWVCTADQAKGHKFRVVFDGEGKCTQTEHTYDGPLPICLGGSFQPVTVSGTIAGLGHDLGGALEVASVEPDSVAARAGLVPGDILVSFADRPLPTGDGIQAMRQIVFPLKQQGDIKRAIKVLRGGQLIELSLTW